MLTYIHIGENIKKYKNVKKIELTYKILYYIMVYYGIYIDWRLSSPCKCQTLTKSPSSLIISGPPTSSSLVKEHGSLAKDYISQPPLSWVLAKGVWAEVVIESLKGEGVSSGFFSPSHWLGRRRKWWEQHQPSQPLRSCMLRKTISKTEESLFWPWSNLIQPACWCLGCRMENTLFCLHYIIFAFVTSTRPVSQFI